jgi:CrcB protein
MIAGSPAAFLLVMLGGAAGSAARYGVSLWIGGVWATLAVNIAGSAAIGLAAGLGGEARLLLVTGVLGGFTTFSAFSLEAATLWDRSPLLAAAYVAASVVLGLAAFWVARRLVAG